MNTIHLKNILPTWTPGTAISHRNLTLVPLKMEKHQARFQSYLLASEAIDVGVLTVTEVDESGTVPELLAINDADQPILLIDGEELQGAKQNRILNTSVLMPLKSKDAYILFRRGKTSGDFIKKGTFGSGSESGC